MGEKFSKSETTKGFIEEFIKNNPNTSKKFVEGVSKTFVWSQTTPREKVIQRFEQIMKERDRNEDAGSLLYWQSSGVSAEGGVIEEEDFKLWIDKYKKSGEVKNKEIQVDDVYTNEFNPYSK